MATHKTKTKKISDPEFVLLNGGCFQATCSCGWESDKRSRLERADNEASAHLRTATEE